MAVLPIHNYFSLNGKLLDNRHFVASENEGGIYEVIRIVDGIPLFFEDHIDRFYRSAVIAGIKIKFGVSEIRSTLSDLIHFNEVRNGNVLISHEIDLKAFFMVHSYPDELMYSRGVACGLLHAERMNPNAKIFQTEVRMQANNLIEQMKYYEVLLVDHSGLITEGSRSNVFFLLGNQLVTPPAKQVLLGITRQKTLQCAQNLQLNFTETPVPLKDISQFDAVFITGTSPKILPVASIDFTVFDAANRVLRQLMAAFDTMVSEYISSRK